MRQTRAQAQHAARAQLQRALDSMTVGFERGKARAEHEIAPHRPGEMTHQLHVPVRGSVRDIVQRLDVSVSFAAAPFLIRIQADPDDELETVNPTFSFGYELQSDGNVMMTACVREWLLDDRGLMDGARLRVFAVVPGAETPVAFTGIAHLSFLGYAAPTDDDDDGTATSVGGGDFPSGGTDNIVPFGGIDIT